METIVLTISRGWIARNLLSTDFYTLLRERYKLVILTPAHSDVRFLKSFAHPNVQFMPLTMAERTMFDHLIFFIHKHLIYNDTVDHHARWGIIGLPGSKDPTFLQYLLIKSVFFPLSKLPPLRTLMRAIDRMFFQRGDVAHYLTMLRDIKPACVITTNVVEDGEVALMKAARALGITTVGIPKSWDNLSQHGFRFTPDTLVVWNEFMKDQAVAFQNYDPKDVEVIGVPQYDLYHRHDMQLSREAFARIYGFDPKKKIIVLGSEGKLFPSDADIAHMIAEAIKAHAFPKDAQLLIRPHHGYRNDADKFKVVDGMSDVAIDRMNEPSLCFKDAWDYSDEFTRRFVNTLRHADVLLNMASTLTLDAVYFDVPIINTAIDGERKVPYRESIERWYETDYYKKILSFNATTFVRTKEELLAAISKYLGDRTFKAGERKALCRAFAYSMDGQASRRFAEVVTRIIETDKKHEHRGERNMKLS